MRVIGTAGHVDHGKSTLVEALTGIHPDRLKEEREREMTIDLGFAWFTLPHGEEVGIVDVPGHRDFIENMLAGVGGIDAALFVIAADEGMMPQTREHLAILDILQIQTGVIALSKIDLIDDPDWLDLVETEIREGVSVTVLKDAEVIRVSARTGAGLAELKTALSKILAERPPRADLNRPRLSIDRVFSVMGFGSVVTGTLIDGSFKMGDEIEILPQNLHGRIRGLQTHKRKETQAIAGSRTAVNISGIALEQIQRGSVLAHPGDYQPDRRLDVRFRLLPEVGQALKHNTEVKLFIGATEVVARARVLGAEELAPGEEGWLQLELTEPVVSVRGDHYILRRPSPGETLGGGTIVDPHPKERHKRFSVDVLAGLESFSHGSPVEVLHQALIALGVATLKDVVLKSALDENNAEEAVRGLITSGLLIPLERDPAPAIPGWIDNNSPTGQPVKPLVGIHELVTSKSFWSRFTAQMTQEVEAYHQSYPLRPGIPREELKSRLKPLFKSSPRLFNLGLTRLIAEGFLGEERATVHIPGFTVQFTPLQTQSTDKLLARFAQGPVTPPSVAECQTVVGGELFLAMVETGKLIMVSSEVVFRQEDYKKMVEVVRGMLEQKGTVSAAEVRDALNTSRKYALALLEYLDGIGMTVREGDVRRLKK